MYVDFIRDTVAEYYHYRHKGRDFLARMTEFHYTPKYSPKSLAHSLWLYTKRPISGLFVYINEIYLSYSPAPSASSSFLPFLTTSIAERSGATAGSSGSSPRGAATDATTSSSLVANDTPFGRVISFARI